MWKLQNATNLEGWKSLISRVKAQTIKLSSMQELTYMELSTSIDYNLSR